LDKSSSLSAVWAVFLKEFRSEIRQQSGLWTVGLFSLITVVVLAFSLQRQDVSPTLHAGLLQVALLFSAMLTLPRSYLVEDEQQTFDFLRMMCEPEVIFWGKLLYIACGFLISGLILVGLYSFFGNAKILHPELLILGIVTQTLSLPPTMAICGSLAMSAQNRWILVASIALPLLLPQMVLAVGISRVAFGDGSINGAWINVFSMIAFGLAMAGLGPFVSRAMHRPG